MKIMVTGGGGFLGSAIVRMLRARGDMVSVLCRGKYPKIEQSGVEIVRGDIADLTMVTKAAQGCDAIVHVNIPINVKIQGVDHVGFFPCCGRKILFYLHIIEVQIQSEFP